ncbi:MAG: MoaD/ThiS family protein [Rhodospirillales bacterium]
MVKVTLNGSLRSKAGGQSEFDIDAADIRDLFRQLGELQPKLKPLLDDGVVVAIDNQIYRDSLFQPLPEGSDVQLLPKLAGG